MILYGPESICVNVKSGLDTRCHILKCDILTWNPFAWIYKPCLSDYVLCEQITPSLPSLSLSFLYTNIHCWWCMHGTWANTPTMCYNNYISVLPRCRCDADELSKRFTMCSFTLKNCVITHVNPYGPFVLNCRWFLILLCALTHKILYIYKMIINLCWIVITTNKAVEEGSHYATSMKDQCNKNLSPIL